VREVMLYFALFSGHREGSRNKGGEEKKRSASNGGPPERKKGGNRFLLLEIRGSPPGEGGKGKKDRGSRGKKNPLGYKKGRKCCVH